MVYCIFGSVQLQARYFLIYVKILNSSLGKWTKGVVLEQTHSAVRFLEEPDFLIDFVHLSPAPG